MGLLERLLFRKWPRPNPPLTLAINLVEPSLGPVRLGTVQSALPGFLGPPVSWGRMRQGLWEYPEHAVLIHTQQEQVTAFGAGFLDAGWAPPGKKPPAVSPFTGRIVTGAGASTADKWSVERAFNELGQPTVRDDDDEETVLTYEYPGWGMDIEFTPAGQLQYIHVYENLES